MAFIKAFLQLAWGFAPITVVCLALFLRWGLHEYPLAMIVALIDLIEPVILVGGET